MTNIRSSRQDVFCKKGVLRNFAKFTEKHLCQSLFFNKVAGLRPATLLKKRLWHRCFPVDFMKFLRIYFLQNTSGRLLLSVWIFCSHKFRSHVVFLKFTQSKMLLTIRMVKEPRPYILCKEVLNETNYHLINYLIKESLTNGFYF